MTIPAPAAPASQTLSLDIAGMTCASCVSRVEKALARVEGVEEVSVNLATERATLRLAPSVETPSLLKAVAKVGYEASVRTPQAAPTHHHHDEDASRLRRDTLLAAALTLPLFILEMGGHLYPPFHHALMSVVPEAGLRWLSFVLATLVLFGPGRVFFRIGLPALFRGAPEMNSLVALGAGAAWAFSTVVTIAPQLIPDETRNVYFEAAAVIVTLILLGRWLEARAKGRTGAAISRLIDRQARSARVERHGTVVDLPVEDVRVGDIVLVRPGEKIALDGEVIDGQSHIDESMVTGEPLPAARGPRDPVIGGTLNTTGSFRFRVTKVGGDTLLAQMIRMVEEAQAGKLPIQQTVDRVTAWFVPAVMVVALATFAIWLVWGPEPQLSYALVNAVAVLIIACPCAMGLATPTSILVGTGRAAELGVLFRKSQALQQLRTVKVVAFDKTGTLTEGKPSLTDFILDDDFDHDEVLALVAAAESRSEHPIGLAIADAATKAGLALPQVEDFTAEAGGGICARVGGRQVRVGSARYLSDVDLSDFDSQVTRLAEDGKTTVFAAIDGKPAAAIVVADAVRSSSAAAIAGLHARGLKTVMISGDRQKTAEAVGRALGIDTVKAEVRPADKVATLRALREQFGPVAFVGDGINDAPALAEADVGIAVGTGTDAAIESADVVLVGSDIRAVADAFVMSRATMRNIGENLFWAFGYNVLLVPVAAGILYPGLGTLLSPMLGAGAMALSSVLVVSNAQRLRLVKGETR